MAAENTFEVDYELNVSQAKQQLEEVRKQLNGITADFNQAIKVNEAGVKRLKDALKEITDTYKNGTLAQQARAQARADSIERSYYGRISQSTGVGGSSADANNLNKAIAQSVINDIRNSSESAQASIREAIVKQTVSMLRTTESAIAARVKTATFNNTQSIANSDDRLLAAKNTLANQRRADTIYSAENGRAALASRNRLEAINYNGGADLMGIQGRVMMNYMAVGSIFSGAKALTSNIVELDKELHQFQAISTATNGEMGKFKKNLLEIAQTVPFTTLEITKAATALAQAGLSTQQVTESLGAISMFATATGSDLGQAVDVVTSTLTAFNLETNRTGEVANVFTAALNLSKLSVDKLVTSMNYIGPTAASMGITLEETTSILGALSQSGVRASTMGTGFRALLTDLQTPTKKLIQTLQAAGLSVEDINVKTKGFLPVIETLKKAGFGAAEAYGALETRSAAAYLALANNTQLAYDMQKSFTLSAAAVEANKIQMESLSNAGKNLASIISASVYTAFEPMVEMFATVAKGATSLFGVLNDFPNLLKALGVAVTTLGTVMTASLGLSLVKSFSIMVPVIGNVIAGLSLMATEALAASTATGALSAAFSVLSLVSPAGWIGIAIAGVVAATSAFFAWRGSSDELADSIDGLKGRVNELEGAADAAASKVVTIDTAIQGLVDRKDELDKNELMRGAKIDELRSQFHELGLSIKDDTTSVTDLIRELHNLKATTSKVRAAELTEAVATSQKELDLLKKQQGQLADPNGRLAYQAEGAATALVNGREMAIERGQRGYFVDEISKRLGPQIGEALKVTMGDLSGVKNDPLGAAALPKYINARIAELDRPDADQQTRENIAFLQELSKVLEPLVGNITRIGELEQNIKRLSDERANVSVQNTNAYKRLDERKTNLAIGVDARMKDLAGLTDEQKIDALHSIQKWLEDQTDATLNAFKREFDDEKSSNPALAGLDPDTVANEVRSEMGKATLSINEKVIATATDLEKAIGRVTKKAQTTQSKRLAQWERQISSAGNTEAFEAAKKGYDDFQKSSTAQIVAYYDEMIKLLGDRDPTETENLRKERDDFLDGVKAQEEERQRDNEKKAQDLLKQSLQRQREAVQDVASGLQKQIDTALAELKRTSPGAAFEALVQKIKELNGQLSGELGKVNNINVQLDGIELNDPISKATAGNAQSIIQNLIERGFSKVGASAIAGNLSVESEFNPNAKGDWDPDTKKMTAFGLAQWRNERWDALKASTSTPWDTGSQLNFLVDELRRKNPDLFKRLVAGGEDVNVLTKAFMDQYEIPNKDPSINHVAKRMDRASAFLGGADASSSAKLAENDANLAATIDERNAAHIEAMSDATIKNLKSRLGNLKTQVRFTDDAKSLEGLQKQIHDTYDQMETAEIEKFKAANAELEKSNPTDYQNKLRDLRDGLHENLNSDIQKVMEEYFKAAEEELNRPVDRAKAALDVAQQPDMASKYTALDVQKLQQNVVDREREAAANRVLLIEQQIAEVRRMANEAESTYGAGSSEAMQWRNVENDLIKKNNELKQQNNLLDAAKAKQAPGLSAAINSATVSWAQQNGILDSQREMIPLATQVGNAWGEVLDGLSSGFSQFFINISSGTMKASDAFKQLGQSVLSMFMQIIAKALANQIIMSLFGGGDGGDGGSSFLGALGKALFGVVGGKANGGMIRAANGTVAPFRDGGMYQLMPGEMVLRQSAVQAIGEDKLTQLNNLGNRQISEGALQGVAANSNKKQEQGVVNVWVVSPDQVPQSGPNDIIATVSQNIQNRGTLKQLIQQVAVGAI